MLYASHIESNADNKFVLSPHNHFVLLLELGVYNQQREERKM